MLEQEKTKYQKMWEFDQYRKNSPGERLVGEADAKFGKRSSLIDFGCGTGRAAQKFEQLGYRVIGIDIAANCLDDGIKFPFFEQCLWEPCGLSADYGFCTDVMEHIPPDYVDAVLENIAKSTGKSFFQIATFKDGMGKLIGDTLHLTVEGVGWWRNRLQGHFSTVEISQRNGGVVAFCES